MFWDAILPVAILTPNPKPLHAASEPHSTVSPLACRGRGGRGRWTGWMRLFLGILNPKRLLSVLISFETNSLAVPSPWRKPPALLTSWPLLCSHICGSGAGGGEGVGERIGVGYWSGAETFSFALLCGWRVEAGNTAASCVGLVRLLV